ncbi:MAG: hypothetical protein E7493_13440 [Ruminococcus albus]|nr:hypothetical protein [Ruminococcus albus]
MTESEPFSKPSRPTKQSKNAKLSANQSARSSLAPAGLREFEGRALNRGSSPQAAQRISWANKAPTERGQNQRPQQAKTRAIRKEKSVRKTIEQHKAMCVHRIARAVSAEQRSVFGGCPSLQRISLSIV